MFPQWVFLPVILYMFGSAGLFPVGSDLIKLDRGGVLNKSLSGFGVAVWAMEGAQSRAGQVQGEYLFAFAPV